MRLLFLLSQQFLFLVIARQVQGFYTIRASEISGEGDNPIGGCNAAEIEIILEEIKTAHRAAELAAVYLTRYPYFQALQGPSYFPKNKLEDAGKELFTRITALLSRSNEDDGFIIQCRDSFCERENPPQYALTVVPPYRNEKPIISLCDLFFSTSTSTKSQLSHYETLLSRHSVKDRWSRFINMEKLSFSRLHVILHELTHTPYVARPLKEVLGEDADEDEPGTGDFTYGAYLCYRLARGDCDMLYSESTKPHKLDCRFGARKAAENADSWALIATGIYASQYLNITQIPIPGISDATWGDMRNGIQ
ncbi:hypothetical protein CTA2_1629 [Colletotrichum tanaceti]|nr:hypothetical protein CTA2_1629 [Colletotrichum tanaceti]